MKPQIVSFHCVLKNKLGKVLGSTFNHDVITHAKAPGAPLKGLAEGMQGLKKGERRQICVSADAAYGFYDPKKVITKSRDELSAYGKLRVGESVILRSATGTSNHYRVTEIGPEIVTFDGNHPLAGQDLIFEIHTVEARDATDDELLDSEDQIEEVRAH